MPPQICSQASQRADEQAHKAAQDEEGRQDASREPELEYSTDSLFGEFGEGESAHLRRGYSMDGRRKNWWKWTGDRQERQGRPDQIS